MPRFAAVSSDAGASIAFRAVVLVGDERDERSIAIVAHEGAGAWSEPAIVRNGRFV